MVVIQGKSGRKASGKKKKSLRGKRLFERGSKPMLTGLGERKLKNVREKGGSRKVKLLKVDVANVLDNKTRKWSKAKILTITDCPANRNFVRRNIMTCGTVINTDKGKARITNRPGQEGAVNAVLID
ncbi:30S ribosomal protein S8e [Candidatus Woesearchaeota archaeon CG10_big_fil_rev_8_21_14_0_10_44_13]|nr:MAG: 30S ribosomal protein S8e [Candidatus Woesearchaeota archaeon CG10_big_fil_rev_8_21_14_0_10_44_13]